MLNKEELEKLLKEQNYIEISNIFEREYREIIYNFAQKNGMVQDEKIPFCTLVLKIRKMYPQYAGYMKLISMACFNESVPLEESVEILVSNYQDIKQALE